jgi:hypothetical protein
MVEVVVGVQSSMKFALPEFGQVRCYTWVDDGEHSKPTA